MPSNKPDPLSAHRRNTSNRNVPLDGLPVLLMVLVPGLFSGGCAPAIPEDAPEQIEAVRSFGGVVDGDTIRTYSGQLIRLIGVDAPEIDGPYTSAEPGGKASTSFVRSFLEDSDVVYLEFGKERYDEHGRLLAYVYREKDYHMLNRVLVEQGWAEAYRKYSYGRKQSFIEAEDRAKRKKKGIWSMR